LGTEELVTRNERAALTVDGATFYRRHGYLKRKAFS
jgi:hypothetical protein